MLRLFDLIQVQWNAFAEIKSCASYDLICACKRLLWVEKGLERSRVEVRKSLRSLELSTVLVFHIMWWLELEGWEQMVLRYILKIELTGIGHGRDMKMREKQVTG